MSRKRVIVVTVGIMLSLFMAAVESTVVATAMPTIVSESAVWRSTVGCSPPTC